MKKYFLIAIIVFLLNGCAQKENNLEKNKTVRINGHEIMVEIADTPEKQYQGLSFRKNLCADCGMLFVFKEKGEKTFVMREMNFPLDIIFIDGILIVKIYKNLPPASADSNKLYNSGQPVNLVLEVNGGFTDRYNIKERERIDFSLK